MGVVSVFSLKLRGKIVNEYVICLSTCHQVICELGTIFFLSKQKKNSSTDNN